MEVGQKHSSLEASDDTPPSASAAPRSFTLSSSSLPPLPPPLPVQEFPCSWHGAPARDVSRYLLSNDDGFFSPSFSPSNRLVGHDDEDDGRPPIEPLCRVIDSSHDGHTNSLTQQSNSNPDFHQTNAQKELLNQAIQNQFRLSGFTFCPPTLLRRQQNSGFTRQQMQRNIMSDSVSRTNHDPPPMARAAFDDPVLPMHYFPAAGTSSLGEPVRRGLNPLQLQNNVMAEEGTVWVGNELITNQGERSSQSSVNAKQEFHDPGQPSSAYQRRLSQSPKSSFSAMPTAFGRSNSDSSGYRTHLPQHHFLHLATAQEESSLPPLHRIQTGNQGVASSQATGNIPGLAFDRFVQQVPHSRVLLPPSKSEAFVVESEKMPEECDGNQHDSVNATKERRKGRNSTKSAQAKANGGDTITSGRKKSAANKKSVDSNKWKEQQAQSQSDAFSSATEAIEADATAPAQNAFIAPSMADGARSLQNPAVLSGGMMSVSHNFFSNCSNPRGDTAFISTTATVSPPQLSSQVKSKNEPTKTRRKSKTSVQKKATKTSTKNARDTVDKSWRNVEVANLARTSHELENNLQLNSADSTTQTNPRAASSDQPQYIGPSMPSHCNTAKSGRMSPSLEQNDDSSYRLGSLIAQSNHEHVVEKVRLPNRLQTETDALSTCSFSASHIDSDDQDLADTFSEQHEVARRVKEIYDVDSGRMELIMIDANVKKSDSKLKKQHDDEPIPHSSFKDEEQYISNNATKSVTNGPANRGENPKGWRCDKCFALNDMGATTVNAYGKTCTCCQSQREYAGVSLECCDPGEKVEDRVHRQKGDQVAAKSETTKRMRLDNNTHNPYSFERTGSGRKDLSRLLGGSSCSISTSHDISNEMDEHSTKESLYQLKDRGGKSGCTSEFVSCPLTTYQNGTQSTNVGMSNCSQSTDPEVGVDSISAAVISDIASRELAPIRISDSTEFDRSLSEQCLEMIIPETGSVGNSGKNLLSEVSKENLQVRNRSANFTLPHKSEVSNAQASACDISVIDSSRNYHSRNHNSRCFSKTESEESKVVRGQGISCERYLGLKVKTVDSISPPSDMCKVVPRPEKKLNLRYPHAPMGQIWLNQSFRLSKSKKGGADLSTRGTLIGRRWVWDEGYFIDAHFNPSLTTKNIPLPSGCTCGANHVNAPPKLSKRSSSISDNTNAGRMRRSERSCTGARMASVINQLASGTLSPHTLIACEDYTHGPEFRFSETIPTEDVQPFSVRVSPDATFLADLHAHLCDSEIIGFLGGHYSKKEKCIYIQATFPCKSTDRADSGYTDVEMDPVSQIYAREAIDTHGMSVVGWYHSHPTFQPDPSVTDIENQANYQQLFAETSNSSGSVIPFVGLIVGTYDSRNPTSQSVMRWFHVRKKETAAYKSVHFPMNLKTTYRRFRKIPDNESNWQQAREEMSIRGADIREAQEARYLSCPLKTSTVAELPFDFIDANISEISITDREKYSERSLTCDGEVVKDSECDTNSELKLKAHNNDDQKLHSQTTLVHPSPEDSATIVQFRKETPHKEPFLALTERLLKHDLKAEDPNKFFPEARPLYFTEKEKSILEMQFGSASYDIIGGIIWHAVEREQRVSRSSSSGSSSLIPTSVPASSGAIFKLMLSRTFPSVCARDRRLYDIFHCIEEKNCDDLLLETAFESSDAVVSHNVDVLISHYLSKPKKLSPFSSWSGSGDKGNIFKSFGPCPPDDHDQWRDLYFTKILQMQRVVTNGSVTYQGGPKMRRGHKMAACLLKWASGMQLSLDFGPRVIDPEDCNILSFDHEKALQLQTAPAKSGRSQNVHYYFVAEVMRLLAAKWRESECRSPAPMKRVRLSGQEADQSNDFNSRALAPPKARRKSRKKK